LCEGNNEEDDRTPPHQQALKEIQSMEKEDIDRITSIVVSLELNFVSLH